MTIAVVFGSWGHGGDMAERGVYDDAGKASAQCGQVLLDGPDGISISLTPAAAEGTARALLDAASEARTQQPKETI